MTDKFEAIEPDTLLTSHEVGTLLQVNPSSVNKWVKDGHIEAFRTPGGHRRIRAADVVRFLNTHQMPVPASLKGLTKRRLLVTDDDQAQLDALIRAFKPYEAFVEVRGANNGIEALLQIGSFRPQLVVLDVVMPEIDGFEVSRRLREREDTKDVFIVLTSGRADDSFESKAKAAGANLFAPKPIEPGAIMPHLGVKVALAG